ncbi:hypothetical protein [Macrococcoides canis]|uniref:hypothetical protein n=1 Tax=Macrococcoides canis TaxID=1855823 RepID=UPI0010FBD681|nr:hypothetical protein [Macrococcus canis]QCT74133.1 hypothetical protein EST43_02315 [Macrococcus canis]
MKKKIIQRTKESIIQDHLFQKSKESFLVNQYEKLIKETIKHFVIENKNKFKGLFTDEIFEVNMYEFYKYVIEKHELGYNKTNEIDRVINTTLNEIVEHYKIFNINQENRYEYVYVVQKNNGMISVVGKSYFCLNLEKKTFEGTNDLFEDISFFKYDNEDDTHKDKLNLSLNDLKGNQAIETIIFCIENTGNQEDFNILDDYFKNNKDEIRRMLRRLYKKAWIIPIKGEEKNAEDFETALGNHLEEQEYIFISNKDSHKY